MWHANERFTDLLIGGYDSKWSGSEIRSMAAHWTTTKLLYLTIVVNELIVYELSQHRPPRQRLIDPFGVFGASKRATH